MHRFCTRLIRTTEAGVGLFILSLLPVIFLASCRNDVVDFVDRGIGYDLSITTSGGTGSVSYAAGNKVLIDGTVVTLTPTPGTDYYFQGWSGTNGNDVYRDGSSWKILMDEDKLLVAEFGSVAIPIITVSGTGIARTVTISAASGCAIYYTEDGTMPTTSSSVYGSPITVLGFYVTKTIRAIAEKSGISSAAASATVRIMSSSSSTLSLGAVVTTIAGSTTSGSADGIGTAATFNYPTGIATDGANLYVSDYYGQKIRRVVIATGEVTTLAGSGSAVSADGIGTAASFKYPWGIATDGINLYVADNTGNKIRRVVIATGEVTTIAGSGSGVSADGTGTAASIFFPRDVTTDGVNLFVAEFGGNKIRKIVISTGAVTTLAGSGSAGSADGTGTAATFDRPAGITTDGANLYISDSGSNKIRKMVISTGAVTTLAGSGSPGSADGTGTAATFYYPTGIATDGVNLYVADNYSHKIRKIVIATGEVTTLAGTGVAGSADGTGTSAGFNRPYGVTTDGLSLYVTEGLSNRIRRIQ